MARGNVSAGKLTPRADEINADKWVLGEEMPEIKQFVPGYNPALVIEDGGQFAGIKNPWFLPAIPGGADPDDYYIYDPVPANFNDITDALQYDDGGGAETLRCDIKDGQVTRILGIGAEPTKLRIILEKLVDEYERAYTGPNGSEANVFYILDENDEIICVLHSHGLTFDVGNKWEIVQHLVFQHDEPITSIMEDPDPFHIKTAAEILLPDIIVGSGEDKLNGKAGYNIAQFSDPGLDIAGQRVLFLPTVGPLDGDAVKNGSDVRFKMLGQGAALDLAGHSLTLGGNNLKGYLRVVNAVADSLIISGSDIDMVVQADDDLALDFTGSGICVVNGHVFCRDIDADDLNVDGNLTVAGSSALKSASADSLDVTDDAGGSGDLNVDGKADIGGDLTVAGSSTLKSASADSLDVTDDEGGSGDLNVDGKADIGGDLTVGGSSTLKSASADSLDVTDDEGGSGDLNVDNDATVGGDLTVGGTVSADVFEAGLDIKLGGLSLYSTSQPDRVVLTASEQALYASSPRILRYDQTAKAFLDGADNVVADNDANPFPDGDWIVVGSMEELDGGLYLKGNKLKIETDRKFAIPLGDMGGGNPYPVFIQGDECLVDLWLDKSMEDLSALTGVFNGLPAVENRRVIKNQGKGNRIVYNNQQIFRGREPGVEIGFVAPPHNPYCLEWDNNVSYDAAARTGDPSNNALKCWFWELHQALGRRFNDSLPGSDTQDAWLTVRPPPREAYFFRAPGVDDPDRHSRPAWEQYGLGSGMFETIPGNRYNESGGLVSLGGSPTDKTANINKVRDGMRVQDAGNLPQGEAGTTIVRPGSIDRVNYTFELINAEDGAAVTGASGLLTLDFSGMAAGSTQTDAFQGHWHEFGLTGASLDNGVYTSVRYDYPDLLSIYFNNRVRDAVVDESGSGDPRTAAETRPQNMLIVPYYRL